MPLELIVAISNNGIIGKKNEIPWYIPEDLQRFKKITQGTKVIMGRKTYDSLPNKPLKNRTNIVITKEPEKYAGLASDNVIYGNIADIFTILSTIHKDERICIIGGCEIYSLFWKYCSIFHITIVDEIIEGDVQFPYSIEEIENTHTLQEKSEIQFSRNNHTPYYYSTYVANSEPMRISSMRFSIEDAVS